MVVVKPGAFKTLEEVRRAYPELMPIVEATPTCIVYSSGRINCWGSSEALERMLNTAASIARQFGIEPATSTPPDAEERVRRAAEEIAALVKAGRDNIDEIERIEREHNVFIIRAADERNGKYLVTVNI